jgi:putative tryptophan/tyrosine transport system substrate-binding protein
MNRREFVVSAGAIMTGWPAATYAQPSAMPVIGFLHPASPDAFRRLLEAFREGLNEHGYVEGRNLRIEYRWAEGRSDRLNALALELVRQKVALIAAPGGSFAALAAKAVTSTTPVLFIAGPNPVGVGLVASIARPGGNATGVSMESTDMLSKRLEILRDFVPADERIAMLMSSEFTVEKFERDFVEQNQLIALKPGPGRERDLEEYDDIFAAAARNGAAGLIVSADPTFTARSKRIVDLASKYALPAVYPWRQYAAAGGLASYGPNLAEAYRQIGRYAGRILGGAKPNSMPVEGPNTFELVINLKTANALGIKVPDSLIAVANEKLE